MIGWVIDLISNDRLFCWKRLAIVVMRVMGTLNIIIVLNTQSSNEVNLSKSKSKSTSCKNDHDKIGFGCKNGYASSCMHY